MGPTNWEQKKTKLQELLVATSRSFALSLIFLPRRERNAVSIVYLLARYADTLADGGNWPFEKRFEYLELWEKGILGDRTAFELQDSVGGFRPSEAELLLNSDLLLESFYSLNERQIEISRELLKTLIHAMKWDLKTFLDPQKKQNSEGAPLLGCADERLFDWYTQSIAGCVGSFWTRIFGLPEGIESFATAYGRGLQRINILRDVIEDWEVRGRIYFPESLLKKFKLNPSVKLWEQGEAWENFIKDYIQKTEELLLKGAQFVDLIPSKKFRLRFSSILPALIGLQTLKRILREPSRPTQKISRSDIQKTMLKAAAKVGTFSKFSSHFR